MSPLFPPSAPHSKLARRTFRKKKNLVLACLTEVAAPLLKAGASAWSKRPPSAPETWRRGIFLGAAHIGDILYNSSSLPALKTALPNCDWYFAAPSSSAQVLANNPFIAGTVQGVDELESVDVAICYNSGSYWRDVFAAVRRGIPNRVAYVHKGLSAFTTFPIAINYPQPFPSYFRDLVAQVSGTPGDCSLRPKVFPSSADADIAGRLFAEMGLDPSRPLLACFVTSRQPSGVWPVEKFAATLRMVEEDRAVQTVLLGSEGDASILRKMRSEFGLRAQVAAGNLPLLGLVCFLQRCGAVLSTDSGPRHLANAAGVPVVYVRNISFSKVEAGPYCEGNYDFAPEVEFVSVAAQRQILETVDPAAVADTVSRLLRGETPAAPPFA